MRDVKIKYKNNFADKIFRSSSPTLQDLSQPAQKSLADEEVSLPKQKLL